MIKLSIFNNLLGNKEYSFKVKNMGQTMFLSRMAGYISSGSVRSSEEREIFSGKINKSSFDLDKKSLAFSFGKDLTYNVKGRFFFLEKEEVLIKCKFTTRNYVFKHTILIVFITIGCFFATSAYNNLTGILITMFYYFLMDLFFNVDKALRTNRSKEHFGLFLKGM